MNRNSFKIMLLLCILLFFLLAGESMVLPALVPTLAEPVSEHFDMLKGQSEYMHNLAYGLALGIFPICLFFAAPIIGSISDNYARKPLIVMAVVGAFVSYIFQALAMSYMMFLPFIFGRSIAGITTGVDGVIQAFLLDNSSGEKRAQYLSYTLLAMSVGIFVGPMLTALLINPNAENPQFAWSLPFYLMVAVFLIMIPLIMYMLPKYSANRLINKKTKLDWFMGIRDLKNSWKDYKLRKLSIPFIIVNSAYGCFLACVAIWLSLKCSYSLKELSAYFSVGGIAAFSAFAFFGPYFIKKYNPYRVAKFGIALTAISIFAPLVYPNKIIPFIFMVFDSIAISVYYLAAIDIYSESVSESKRGWMLSVASSLWGLSQGIGLAISGMICAFIGASWGLFLCAGVIFISYYLFPNFKKPQKNACQNNKQSIA